MSPESPAEAPASDARSPGDNDLTTSNDTVEITDKRRWWRRPRPLWAVLLAFLMNLNSGLTIALRPELTLDLVCIAHGPSNSSVSGTVGFGTLGVPGQLPFSAAGIGWDEQWQRIEQTAVQDHTDDTVVMTSTSPPFHGIDPKACRRDVGVQKLTARVAMGIKLIGGLLGVLTIGYWTSASDRLGRQTIFAVSEVGMMLNDATFLVISLWPQILAHTGVSLLLVGPAIDGLLGSVVFMTTLSPYVADCAAEGGIAVYFAIINGALMAAMVIGPTLGSFLIKMSGDIVLPFKVVIVTHAAFLLLLLYVLPESLSSEVRKRARVEYSQRTQPAELERSSEPTRSVGRRLSEAMRNWTRHLAVPLEPLRVFKPRPRHLGARGGKDWNLLLLAVASFIVGATTGIGDPKTQYAMYAFGWDNAQLGPFMSVISAFRCFVLLGLVPLIGRYVKPYFTKGSTGSTLHADSGEEASNCDERSGDGSTERSPLLQSHQSSGQDISVNHALQSNEGSVPPHTVAISPMSTVRFDQLLLCTFFILEVIGYLALGANANASVVVYIAASLWNNLAGPASSYVDALALEVSPRDLPAGRLFGAIGLVNALSQTLISPVLYTSIFTASIGWYPPTIFLVAAASFSLAFVVAALIRPPSDTGSTGDTAECP